MMLSESEATDLAARNEAREAFEKVSAYLKKNVGMLDDLLLPFNNAHMGRGFAINGRRVGLPGDLVILFVGQQGRGVQGGMGHLPDGRTVIMMACLLEPGSTKYLETRFTGAKRTFIHEFMHYQMEKRTGIRDKASADASRAGDHAGYVNHPDETNAYYQEAASEMESWAKVLNEPMVPQHVRDEWAQKSVHELLDFMKRKFLPKDFQSHASAKTMRKFDKRAARFITTTFLPMMRGETLGESEEMGRDFWRELEGTKGNWAPYIVRKMTKDGRTTYAVFQQGHAIALAVLSSAGDTVTDLGVLPEHRRRGIASALYKHIEADIGHPLKRSTHQTADGDAFWKAR